MSEKQKKDELRKFKAYAKFVKNNFWYRISSGKYGAGLIAVQDIPKGTVMVGGHPTGTYIPTKGKKEYKGVKNGTYNVQQFLEAGLTMSQISLMQDFVCRGSNKNNVPIPHVYDMLFPPMYQFGNHSDKPNVKVVGHNLVTLKKIKEGDELFHNYKKVCPGKNEILY